MNTTEFSSLSITQRRSPVKGVPSPLPVSHTHSPKIYPAGREIYSQGERCGALYRVVFGGVRIYRLLSDGRRQISAFCLAGETFGFETDTTHHFFAETICLSGISVNGSHSSVPDLATDLLPMVILGLVRAQEHLLVLGRQDAIQRVAAFLLEMSERQGDLRHIELPMPRNDIADYLGLSIETVSRVISRLKSEGIIRLSNTRCVEILNLPHVQELAA